MSATTAEEIQKHVRVYLTVFAALAALTVITVSVSYLHLPTHTAILVALAIALVKGSLVAAFFMHLISERQVIYWILILCVVFFATLMSLPTFTTSGMVAMPSRTEALPHLEGHEAGH
jgi:cytochrome c oxidase subunit IV